LHNISALGEATAPPRPHFKSIIRATSGAASLVEGEEELVSESEVSTSNFIHDHHPQSPSTGLQHMPVEKSNSAIASDDGDCVVVSKMTRQGGKQEFVSIDPDKDPGRSVRSPFSDEHLPSGAPSKLEISAQANSTLLKQLGNVRDMPIDLSDIELPPKRSRKNKRTVSSVGSPERDADAVGVDCPIHLKTFKTDSRATGKRRRVNRVNQRPPTSQELGRQRLEEHAQRMAAISSLKIYHTTR
jgi:hypothetical protein